MIEYQMCKLRAAITNIVWPNKSWNGMWSNMFIENTSMRYKQSPKAVDGITLRLDSLKRLSQ